MTQMPAPPTPSVTRPINICVKEWDVASTIAPTAKKTMNASSTSRRPIAFNGDTQLGCAVCHNRLDIRKALLPSALAASLPQFGNNFTMAARWSGV